jgi:outer membrane protein OmpA-like peptidoglycan-associated protein
MTFDDDFCVAIRINNEECFCKLFFKVSINLEWIRSKLNWYILKTFDWILWTSCICCCTSNVWAIIILVKDAITITICPWATVVFNWTKFFWTVIILVSKAIFICICPDVAGLPALDGCPDADEDGLADKDDNCPEEFGPIENNGCPWTDRDSDGVLDKDDNCPDVAGTATNAGCPEYPIEGLEDISIKFGSDSFEIDADFEEQLAKAFLIIDSNSDAKIIIEGHADSTGNDQINIPLSELRASQVLDYLIKAGISPERLSIVGYGSSQPLGDNDTYDGRSQNRRVDLTVE